MMPILKMLVPRAVIPPSAKPRHWIVKTNDMIKRDAHGPISIAAIRAPRKCPLVPPAIGKLSICAANINAEVTPRRGICLSFIVLFILRIE